MALGPVYESRGGAARPRLMLQQPIQVATIIAVPILQMTKQGPWVGSGLAKSHSWEVAESRFRPGLSGSELHTLHSYAGSLQLGWLHSGPGLWTVHGRGTDKHLQSRQTPRARGGFFLRRGRQTTVLSGLLHTKCALPPLLVPACRVATGTNLDFPY